MLKRIVEKVYKDEVYTDEKELFCEIFKWYYGLYYIVSIRNFIGTVILDTAGITVLFFTKNKIFSSIFFISACILFILNRLESRNKKLMINEKIRTEKIHFFLMKYVTLNGKALEKEEWKRIKRKDKQLYKDLLSEECDNKCYIYSLEIARMFEDSILIWGAVHNIFSEKEYFCAHAVILRNGYVYDSNIHQSIKYEEYQKLFKLKVFKQYTSCEYLKNDFRVHERADFRKWCKKNNVIKCELF